MEELMNITNSQGSGKKQFSPYKLLQKVNNTPKNHKRSYSQDQTETLGSTINQTPEGEKPQTSQQIKTKSNFIFEKNIQNFSDTKQLIKINSDTQQQLISYQNEQNQIKREFFDQPHNESQLNQQGSPLKRKSFTLHLHSCKSLIEVNAFITNCNTDQLTLNQVINLFELTEINLSRIALNINKCQFNIMAQIPIQNIINYKNIYLVQFQIPIMLLEILDKIQNESNFQVILFTKHEDYIQFTQYIARLITREQIQSYANQSKLTILTINSVNDKSQLNQNDHQQKSVSTVQDEKIINPINQMIVDSQQIQQPKIQYLHMNVQGQQNQDETNQKEINTNQQFINQLMFSPDKFQQKNVNQLNQDLTNMINIKDLDSIGQHYSSGRGQLANQIQFSEILTMHTILTKGHCFFKISKRYKINKRLVYFTSDLCFLVWQNSEKIKKNVKMFPISSLSWKIFDGAIHSGCKEMQWIQELQQKAHKIQDMIINYYQCFQIQLTERALNFCSFNFNEKQEFIVALTYLQMIYSRQ